MIARERSLALACAVGTAAVIVAAAIAARAGARPSTIAILLAAASLPYAGLSRWQLSRRPEPAIAIALIAGFALVLSPSVLSDDLYRYLWDARVLRHGIDPYAYPPEHQALSALRDQHFASINHPEVPTIYPPLAQLVFVLASWVGSGPWAIKLAALLAHLSSTPIVGMLAGAERSRAIALHALCPLALSESALGGHVDAFVGLFVALAALALTRSRPIQAALAIAACTGLKLVGLALVLVLPSRRAIVMAVAVSVLLLLPLLTAGRAGHAPSGLESYARRWRGNESGFLLLAETSRAALDLVGGLTGSPPGWLRLRPLGPVIEALEGTPLDLHPALPPKKARAHPSSFSTQHLGELVARLAAGLILLALAIHLARRKPPSLAALGDLLLAVLLLAPQVHPWYLLWLIPIDIARGRSVAIVWSIAALIAYAPLDGYLADGTWRESTIFRAIEYALVALALAYEGIARDHLDSLARGAPTS